MVVEEGSLYPALYRMERRESIEAEWGTSELGRKAKFYRITPGGRRHLAAETQQWAGSRRRLESSADGHMKFGRSLRSAFGAAA